MSENVRIRIATEKQEEGLSGADSVYDNDDKKTNALKKKWSPAVILTCVLVGGTLLATVILARTFFAKSTLSLQNDPEGYQESDLLENLDIILDNLRLRTDSKYRIQVIRDMLNKVPLIDGHNNLATVMRSKVDTEVSRVDLRSNLKAVWPDSHTDIPRLRKGRIGGQFWSIFIDCEAQYKDAVQRSFEQIDLLKSIFLKYPDVFQLATTSKDVITAHAQGKMASLLGVEGGHMMGESMAILRQHYELGVRYLTLTHNCNTPWADSCYTYNTETPMNNGLTEWGKLVIREMNRIGMMVDLSHVSQKVMSDVLDITSAPIIFSHSSAFGSCPHPCNVPDHILKRLKENGGVVMVNFDPALISCQKHTPHFQQRNPTVTLSQVADHLDYIKRVAGVDHVGIGADYDGIPSVPAGLEDVSKYPDLLAELMRRGWTIEELAKLAGYNVLRVMSGVEKVKSGQQDMQPVDKAIDYRSIPDRSCFTENGWYVGTADTYNKNKLTKSTIPQES